MTETLVVGSGAGGLSAALALARSRHRVLAVDSGTPRNATAKGVHGFRAQDGTPRRSCGPRGESRPNTMVGAS